MSLALLTDFYEITMAAAYWKSGTHLKEAVFHHVFRRLPFQGGFAVAAGLEVFLDFLRNYHFSESDLDFLAGQKGNDGQPLFEEDFLQYLKTLKIECDIDAVPEGTLVFPQEPLVRVSGPIVQCQLLETALLNIVNFQTLIATKAARTCLVARDDSVIDFGLRRAQGPDGGISAARACYIGGCHGTSNTLAGKLYGIPVKGTHAHSWVMSFDTEESAFEAYADAMPNNSIFLVDTYHTVEGVKNAIEAGKRLRKKGKQFSGIRLDSGDLADLSKTARRMLDEAGFETASIVASSDLDEYAIENLKRRGSRVNIWGVGTRLVTGFGDPALGGVYKLSAVRDPGGEWIYKVKTSDEPEKSSVPGILQVRRYINDGFYAADVIYDSQKKLPAAGTMVEFRKGTIHRFDGTFEELLVPVLRAGKEIYKSPKLADIRENTRRNLSHLPDRFKKLKDPDRYPFGLEQSLHALRHSLQR